MSRVDKELHSTTLPNLITFFYYTVNEHNNRPARVYTRDPGRSRGQTRRGLGHRHGQV